VLNPQKASSASTLAKSSHVEPFCVYTAAKSANCRGAAVGVYTVRVTRVGLRQAAR